MLVEGWGTTEYLSVAGLGLAILLLGLILGGFFISRRRGGIAEEERKARQDQFIMLASHYLLTPLSIIQTALARLQEGDADLNIDQRRKLYDAIQAGQKRLWIIAEELVLVNEIEHGTLEPQFAPADISDIVSAAVADIDIFARTKNVTIAVRNTAGQFHEARLDARRLRQALIAILDNAVKFSDSGNKVTVDVSYANNFYEIAVKDDGIGMDKDSMKRIGERFYRGSSLYNFNYEGMGLGLHIAYAIFRAHGGSMTISSEPKRGAIVSARIPML